MSRPTTSVIVSPARWRVVLAFAAIYVIWGTTYLAIRYAIETLPPFLMVGGQGLVTWAELRIPPGLAAVLISTMPIWMLGLNWVRPGGQRPDRTMITGLVVGFAGVVILIAPWQTGARDVDVFGAAAVLIAALSWATGSLYTRSVQVPQTRRGAGTVWRLRPIRCDRRPIRPGSDLRRPRWSGR